MNIFIRQAQTDNINSQIDEIKPISDSQDKKTVSGKELSPEVYAFGKQLGKLNQSSMIYQTNYNALQEIIKTRLNSSFNENLKINENPCSYVIDEDQVVSPEEATDAVNQLLKTANLYSSVLREQLNLLDYGTSLVDEETQQNPEFKKLSQSDLTLDLQKTKVQSDIAKLETSINIEIRKQKQFLVLLPVKMELLDCMLDTCEWYNKAEKTKNIIGFYSSEELVNLESNYTKAIDILKRYQTTLMSVNPQSGRINKNINNVITSFENKRNELYKQVTQRLVPGFGSPGSAK